MRDCANARERQYCSRFALVSAFEPGEAIARTSVFAITSPVVLDWFSRRVLAWRLSITMETAFCVETLEDAMACYGKPEIFNTDQGSQFTCRSRKSHPRGLAR